MGRFVAVLLLGIGAASPAWAQQSQTFTYDAHGRLTGVARTTGGSSQTTAYGFDNADNRTSRTTSAPTGGGLAVPEAEAQATPQARAETESDPPIQAVEAAPPPEPPAARPTAPAAAPSS